MSENSIKLIKNIQFFVRTQPVLTDGFHG